MDEDDAPVFHKYDVPPLAVNVALSPLQINNLEDEIEAIGKVFTVTVLEEVAVQPLPFVTMT